VSLAKYARLDEWIRDNRTSGLLTVEAEEEIPADSDGVARGFAVFNALTYLPFQDQYLGARVWEAPPSVTSYASLVEANGTGERTTDTSEAVPNAESENDDDEEGYGVRTDDTSEASAIPSPVSSTPPKNTAKKEGGGLTFVVIGVAVLAAVFGFVAFRKPGR
jgi:hypothetical protein